MSWADRTREERAALKSRREGRQVRRERLENNRRVEKEQRARTPADWAAFRFDRARKHITAIRDPAERDETWRALDGVLTKFLERFGGDCR